MKEQHHALVHFERSGDVVAVAVAALRERGTVTEFNREAWGIDDSRALAQEASRTDGAGRERLFVVSATSLTVEAQNALLKLFEEPPRGVSFHCYFPPGIMLLPTLLSRLTVVGGTVVDTSAQRAVFDSWIRLPIAEQLSEVEDRTKKKDAIWIEAIKQGGLIKLADRPELLPPRVTTRLFFALRTLGSRGASNKMLLEEIALSFSSLPKTR